jgi:hypothetical protein
MPRIRRYVEFRLDCEYELGIIDVVTCPSRPKHRVAA